MFAAGARCLRRSQYGYTRPRAKLATPDSSGCASCRCTIPSVPIRGSGRCGGAALPDRRDSLGDRLPRALHRRVRLRHRLNLPQHLALIHACGSGKPLSDNPTFTPLIGNCGGRRLKAVVEFATIDQWLAETKATPSYARCGPRMSVDFVHGSITLGIERVPCAEEKSSSVTL